MAAAGGPTVEEKKAIEVAKALISEMEFPNKRVKKIKEDNDLLDEPPPRSKLGFQQRKNLNPKLEDAAKAEMGRAIADEANDTDVKNLFCMVHCEFARLSGVDIEHGMAFEHIKTKQIALLEFLNNPKNQDFSKFFLAQPGISDFFQRDKDQIKGTRFFYRACYNNLKNLWLVCHACNIEKTSKDSLDWFAHQKQFGAAFIASVTRDGGLHSGVIFNAVGGREVAELGGQKVHSGGKGLGEYARKWFLDNHAQMFEANKLYYNDNFKKLQEELEHIEKLWEDGKAEEADRRFSHLKGDMKLASMMMDQSSPSDDGSSSEEERLSQQKRRHAAIVAVKTESGKKRHSLNKLERLIKEKYVHNAGDVMQWFKDMEGLTNNPATTLKEIVDFRSIIEAKLNAPSPLPAWNIFKEGMEKELKKLDKAANLAEKSVMVDMETRLRLAAEQEAREKSRELETEKQKSLGVVGRTIATEQRAEQETEARLEETRKRQALEQEWAELKGASSSASSSSSSPNDMSHANRFSLAAEEYQRQQMADEEAASDSADQLMYGNPKKRKFDPSKSETASPPKSQKPEEGKGPKV